MERAAKSLEGVSLLPGGKQSKSALKKQSNLSKNQKLEIIEKESPELLGLLKDFEGKLSELKNNVQPLLTEYVFFNYFSFITYEINKIISIFRVTKQELPTSEGISFLEAKFHLLLNYCLNIGFYMLMKAEGKQVQDHPVISQLVKIRLLLDKMKPIDQKLHYQVQKLLKMSADGSSGIEQLGEGLQHRPNLDALDTIDQDDDKSGKYKLKKIAPVSYEDIDTKKKKRRVKTDTAMADFIREEFSEAPREISFTGRPKLSKERQAELDFEEENFFRLKKQAKVRQKQEKQLLQRSELEDPLDFRDITGFGDFSDEEDTKSSRKKLGEIISGVEKQTSEFNPEIDIPYKTWDKLQPLSKRTLSDFKDGDNDNVPSSDDDDNDDDINMHDTNTNDNDFDEDVSEDEYYEQVKKKRKLSHHAEEKVQDTPNYRDDTIDPNSKRRANYQVRKNKGLVRSRSGNNPRAKNRRKAEKFNQRIASTGVKRIKDQSSRYEGESTGIRKGVVRSRNFTK